MNKQGIKNSDNIGRIVRGGGLEWRADCEAAIRYGGSLQYIYISNNNMQGRRVGPGRDKWGGGAPANCASIVVPTSSAVYRPISLTLTVPRSKGPLMRRESVELRR